MKHSIVIDLGYGDSGKGITVDTIASNFEHGNVVRYCGGSQCGHGVRIENYKNKEVFHEFRILGSGSLRKLSTILLPNVVFDPMSLVAEFDEVKKLTKIEPHVIISSECKIITPYELYSSQNNASTLSHGSCGKGIFATKFREKQNYHIYAKDLLYSEALKLKLEQLKNWYRFDESIDLHDFLDAVGDIQDLVHRGDIWIRDSYKIISEREHYGFIFESSQGLLLDENIGIFPHCTPSRVDLPEGFDFTDIYLVTRAYHTRHGNGPLTSEHYPVERSSHETNFDNQYQGKFRSGLLDIDMLIYGLTTSNIPEYVYKHKKDVKVHLVVTHCDTLKDPIMYSSNNNETSKYYDHYGLAMNIIKHIEGRCEIPINILSLNSTPYTGHFSNYNLRDN